MKPGRLGEFMTGVLLVLFAGANLLAPADAFVNGILFSCNYSISSTSP